MRCCRNEVTDNTEEQVQHDGSRGQCCQFIVRNLPVAANAAAAAKALDEFTIIILEGAHASMQPWQESVLLVLSGTVSLGFLYIGFKETFFKRNAALILRTGPLLFSAVTCVNSVIGLINAYNPTANDAMVQLVTSSVAGGLYATIYTVMCCVSKDQEMKLEWSKFLVLFKSLITSTILLPYTIATLFLCDDKKPNDMGANVVATLGLIFLIGMLSIQTISFRLQFDSSKKFLCQEPFSRCKRALNIFTAGEMAIYSFVFLIDIFALLFNVNTTECGFQNNTNTTGVDDGHSPVASQIYAYGILAAYLLVAAAAISKPIIEDCISTRSRQDSIKVKPRVTGGDGLSQSPTLYGTMRPTSGDSVKPLDPELGTESLLPENSM